MRRRTTADSVVTAAGYRKGGKDRPVFTWVNQADLRFDSARVDHSRAYFSSIKRSNFGSIGFVIYSDMPARRHLSRSLASAFAVSAMIGSDLAPSPASPARMR